MSSTPNAVEDWIRNHVGVSSPGAAGQHGVADVMKGAVHQAEGPCAGSGGAGEERDAEARQGVEEDEVRRRVEGRASGPL
ncbi:hypothetical protein N7540_013155 [Penicillium herquei]|uniref:uncharacterized protein n=1 Tax=Penicillium angulare TaxID=116970 RepID=UPI00253FBA20|nr:uncharacterized protein N7478_011565 [Penicillium angulare]KAJ5263960.1 hypothetical protein N7478_011565 [Penicillium angulare]KAJ6003873.1 hypothetical protein N7540_013155 [Penicillium herquei]